MTGDLPTAVPSAPATGALAALPLMLGAWLALRHNLPSRLVGLVAVFGAGALICAITFWLVLDAFARGGPVTLGLWLAAGAIAYFLGSELLERHVRFGGAAEAFAAGALLTMLTDDLVPEARERGGLDAGLASVMGFAVAIALHQIGQL